MIFILNDLRAQNKERQLAILIQNLPAVSGVCFQWG